MTDDDKISLDALAYRLDAFGADLARWPADEAEEAALLLTRSPKARALHADAQRLDALVANAAFDEPANGLAFRVVSDIAARRSDRLGLFFGSPGRFGVAGVSLGVAALAVGVALGAATGPAQAGGSLDNLDLGASFGVSFVDGDL